MNCLLVGNPGGTTADVARAVVEAAPEQPVTLLSDDTDGLLRLLGEPGLSGCECLWADPAVPATVDDALVHRRLLHGSPEVVVLVVDRTPEDGGSAWALGELLVARLTRAPLLVTGLAAAALAPRVAAALSELTDDGAVRPPCAVVPGNDPSEVLRRAADLLRSVAVPRNDPATPLLSGHCGH
ncbi:hypothetical protein [Blastococcus sp. PRF04-17]|uniref:hypothetical protein n=1 Tax=Blastococcus sp. PRF04-17 TaxID=2933797 RepID=UPI001FF58EAD|nr:hypothetical protein [Blastococcus sp. PRF04-17]UOY02268.1 hypothetical protein MVA48_02470 [Blastococcus sp. PRF04-17]